MMSLNNQEECGGETGGADVAAAVHVGRRQQPRTTTATTCQQQQQQYAVLDAVNDAAERLLVGDVAHSIHQLFRCFQPD